VGGARRESGSLPSRVAILKKANQKSKKKRKKEVVKAERKSTREKGTRLKGKTFLLAEKREQPCKENGRHDSKKIGKSTPR